MGTSGTFEIVRTPASYIISRSGHGKWEKTGSFRILANYSYAIVSYIEFGNTQFKSISMHWAGQVYNGIYIVFDYIVINCLTREFNMTISLMIIIMTKER